MILGSKLRRYYPFCNISNQYNEMNYFGSLGTNVLLNDLTIGVLPPDAYPPS